MRRWSCTPFNDELDVLEIRLATLDPVVDVHVIAEATRTQRGQRKPLYLAENAGRFARWLPKIRHVVVDDMPRGDGEAADWAREHHQRDALVRAMDDVAPDDLVLFSDVDEIPDPRALRTEQGPGPMRLEMTMHLYYLNWRWTEEPVRGGTRALLVSGAAAQGTKPSFLVEHAQPWSRRQGVAGWHLAYQGGVDRVRRKILSIADDMRRPEFLDREWLSQCMETGRDLFDRGHRQSRWVPDHELPAYVQEHRDRFAHMLIPRPAWQA